MTTYSVHKRLPDISYQHDSIPLKTNRAKVHNRLVWINWIGCKLNILQNSRNPFIFDSPPHIPDTYHRNNSNYYYNKWRKEYLKVCSHRNDIT